MSEVAVSEWSPASVLKEEQAPVEKARFGYRSAKLRVATTLGLIGTGGAGLISSLADVVGSAQVAPVTEVPFNTLAHLKYTVFEPSLPGAVGDHIGMAAISGLVIGAGIVHALRGWKSFKLPSATALGAGGSAILSLAFGLFTYSASVGGDPAVSIEQAWTQQNFSISRELPDPVYDYNSTAERSEWYPAVFSISKADSGGLIPGVTPNSEASGTKEYYYLVEPVLNASGEQVGDNVKQVDKAIAQKAQDLYSQHSSSSRVSSR